MSHPPKLTIFAPRRRCNAFNGVLRSALTGEIVEESVPIVRAETDSNMRLPSGQRSCTRGIALSHRIPLAGLKCVSEKRREELDLLLLRRWESGNRAAISKRSGKVGL